MKPKSSSSLSSTEKALKILMAFAPHNQEMGTLELSKKLDLHKSTVSRLLHLLKDQEFLQQNPDTKKYILGPAVAEIGKAVSRSLNNNIVSIAQPYLNDLSDTVGESVALEVLSGTNVVLAHQVEGQQHIRFTFTLGEQTPLHVAAGAKAILAFSPPDLVKRCLKKKFVPYTAHTILSKVKYREVLKEVRESGVSFDRGERHEDTYAMGAPVFGNEGRPVAAVVIAGPSFRFTPEFMDQAVFHLKQTAQQISQRLFYLN